MLRAESHAASRCRVACSTDMHVMCVCVACRQMCSLEDAKSDFESLIKLKPNHTAAAKELASLDDLQAAFQQLQQLQQAHTDAAAAGAPMPDSTGARAVLDRVYGLAPDCIPAQLLDAQLDMLQGNYEQVGMYRGKYTWVSSLQSELFTVC